MSEKIFQDDLRGGTARPLGAEMLPVVRPPRDPADAPRPAPTSCGVPCITRVWINRPNVQRPREQQGLHPIFDVLRCDGKQFLVWGVQWANGLTMMPHKLDHPIMGKRAVAWIETSATVFVQTEKDGHFVSVHEL